MESRGQPTTHKYRHTTALTQTYTYSHACTKGEGERRKRGTIKRVCVILFKNPFVITNETLPVS